LNEAPSKAPKQTYLALTALGPVSTEVLENFYQSIKNCGCNVDACRMHTVGEVYAISLLLSGVWGAIAKLEDVLPKLGDRYAMDLNWRRTERTAAGDNTMPYAIDLVAADREGIIHDVVGFLRHHQIHIHDIHTSYYETAYSGTRMFTMHTTFSVPADTSIASLRSDFMDFCDQFNLDAIIEPIKHS